MNTGNDFRQLSININYALLPGIGATESDIIIFKANSSQEKTLQTQIANEYVPLSLNIALGFVPVIDNACWSNGNDLLFTKIALTQQILLSCKQCPYVQLLSFLQSGKIEIKKVRITGSTVTATQRNFQTISQDIFGNVGTEEIIPQNFLPPTQVQSNIIDVPINKVMDGDNGLIFKIAQGETINLDFTARIKP